MSGDQEWVSLAEVMAERGGFEPPVRVYPGQLLSRQPCSATPAPLRADRAALRPAVNSRILAYLEPGWRKLGRLEHADVEAVALPQLGENSTHVTREEM
jgi:hypothetical protein